MLGYVAHPSQRRAELLPRQHGSMLERDANRSVSITGGSMRQLHHRRLDSIAHLQRSLDAN